MPTFYVVTNGKEYAFWNPMGLSWGRTDTLDGNCLLPRHRADIALSIYGSPDVTKDFESWHIHRVSINLSDPITE